MIDHAVIALDDQLAIVKCGLIVLAQRNAHFRKSAQNIGSTNNFKSERNRKSFERLKSLSCPFDVNHQKFLFGSLFYDLSLVARRIFQPLGNSFFDLPVRNRLSRSNLQLGGGDQFL